MTNVTLFSYVDAMLAAKVKNISGPMSNFTYAP